MAALLAFQAHIALRTASGQSGQGTIVYFVGNTAAARQGLITVSNLSKSVAARGFRLITTNTWAGVTTEWDSSAFNVLIVDDVSANLADGQWVHDKYRNNAMAVVGLDVPGPALASLVSDAAAEERLGSTLSFSCSEYFSAAQLAITGTPYALTAIAPYDNAPAASDTLDIPTPERMAVSFAAMTDRVCYLREYDRLIHELQLFIETSQNPEDEIEW